MLPHLVLVLTLSVPAMGFFPGFGGSDFRCRFFGGRCKLKHEVCCHKGWIENVCELPKSCCKFPTKCEEKGGTCSDPSTSYCPSGFDDSVKCESPTSKNRCCLENSVCEKKYNGRCLKSSDRCPGYKIPHKKGICGEDNTYKCCVFPPIDRSNCLVGRKQEFCDFLGNTTLTLDDTPTDGSSVKKSLQDQCANGNSQTSSTQCGGKQVCLRPAIVEYLTCLQVACPNAKVISLGGDTYSGGTNSPHCNGRAVAVEIDMSIQPATCDITNAEQFCYEMDAYGTAVPTTPNVYFLRCIFN